MVEPMVPAPPVTRTLGPLKRAHTTDSNVGADEATGVRRPPSLRLSDADSRTSSTRRPAWPSVRGARPSRMADANSATMTPSASFSGRAGAQASPRR